MWAELKGGEVVDEDENMEGAEESGADILEEKNALL